MGIFKRLFKIGQAEAHSLIDEFENPIKMIEQGIRDLKEDLHEALKSLAEAKTCTINIQKEAEAKTSLAKECEENAIELFKKVNAGALNLELAENLTKELLSKKKALEIQVNSLLNQNEKQKSRVQYFQNIVDEIRKTVTSYDAELSDLKARSKAAKAMLKLNKQLSKTDYSGTLSMIEEMKVKIQEREILSQEYSSLLFPKESFTEEIDNLLADTDEELVAIEEIKKKAGL